MGCLSPLISSRARSRHRASRSSFPRDSHPHLVAALTLQTRHSLLLVLTDVHMGRLRMTSFSVVGLLHPPDRRYVVYHTHRRHPSFFDWTPSRPSTPSPRITKIGRMTPLQITTHMAHTCTITKFSAWHSISDDCYDCMTILRLRLPPVVSLLPYL